MALPAWLTFGAVKDIVTGVGKGVGSVLDRIGWTEKMSEEKKFDKILSILDVDMKDTAGARELLMKEMSTQKLPWIVRLINGAYRPIGGYMSLMYLFESVWSQWINQFDFFHWTVSKHDPVIDFCALSIVAFFFGLRQRSKEKAVTDIA